MAARHLPLDHPLHDHVLLDPPAQLVRLRRVEVDVLLELEAQLPAEDPGVVEVPPQEHLVHASQVLFVEEVLVAQELAIDVDLRIPSGDTESLLGTGKTQTKTMFIAASTIGPITPHINVGYTFGGSGLTFGPDVAYRGLTGI